MNHERALSFEELSIQETREKGQQEIRPENQEVQTAANPQRSEELVREGEKRFRETLIKESKDVVLFGSGHREDPVYVKEITDPDHLYQIIAAIYVRYKEQLETGESIYFRETITEDMVFQFKIRFLERNGIFFPRVTISEYSGATEEGQQKIEKKAKKENRLTWNDIRNSDYRKLTDPAIKINYAQDLLIFGNKTVKRMMDVLTTMTAYAD